VPVEVKVREGDRDEFLIADVWWGQVTCADPNMTWQKWLQLAIVLRADLGNVEWVGEPKLFSSQGEDDDGEEGMLTRYAEWPVTVESWLGPPAPKRRA